MFAFKIYDNDVCVTCYPFDTELKANTWQENYITEMKKIGCWPIKGITTKVEKIWE